MSERIDKKEFDKIIGNHCGILPVHCFSVNSLKKYLANFEIIKIKLFHNLYLSNFLDKLIFRDYLVNLFFLKSLASDVCIIARNRD